MSLSDGIEIMDLYVEAGRQPLLKGFCADIEGGGKAVVTGDSGAGKSTLLKCMLGFYPYQGEIKVDGLTLNAENIWQMRRMMAYVPQEPLFEQSTVDDFLKQPFQYKANHSIDYDSARVDSLLQRFKLDSSIKQADTQELSGGEKQRIAIIAALIMERKFIFLDEPTSALDTANRAVLSELIAQDNSLTMLIVSHDKDLIALADKTIEIRRHA